MIEREDLLRLARILDYDRYRCPSMEEVYTPSFEYEYVQASGRTPLDNDCYRIDWQEWKKAKVNSSTDPNIQKKEMEQKMQQGEVRTRVEIETSELRLLLETKPLKFVFDNGLHVIVLPKLTDYPHKVYLRWNTTRNLYTEQYSLHQESELYKKWFKPSSERDMTIDQDWRYLLQLNSPELSPTNVLHKYFEGIYVDSNWNVDLERGTEIYRTETYGADWKEKVIVPPGDTNIDTEITVKEPKDETKKEGKRITTTQLRTSRGKPGTPKLYATPDQQKMICIKDPIKGDIIRINTFYAGKLIKAGWEYASKEEYRAQQKVKFNKRKEMSQGNYEAQLLEYKGRPRIVERDELFDRKKKRGQASSPYTRFQTIKVKPKSDELEQFETIRKVPQYEYRPVVWELWEKKDGKKVKLLETIPFLQESGEPVVRRFFTGLKDEHIKFERKPRVINKTIKVLQIPSKRMTDLQQMMKSEKQPSGEGTPVIPKVRTQQTKYLLSEDKTGKFRWQQIYSEFKQ
jgi:hypothetical protein